MTSSSPRLPATCWRSKPSPLSSSAAASSLSGRRAASVSPYPCCPSMRAMASPIPLDAPVTIAARSAMCVLCVASVKPARRPGEPGNPISYLARTMSLRFLSLAAGVLAVAFAGCGDSEKTTSTPAPSDAKTPKPEDFPKGSELNFSDLQSKYPAQLSLGIGASVMRQGDNRVPFVVLDKGARPVLNAPVALYTVKTDGSQVRGPFLAKETKFDVEPTFLAKTSANDSSTAKVFYTAEIPFKGK